MSTDALIAAMSLGLAISNSFVLYRVLSYLKRRPS